jgi:hypothetical protein
MEELESMYPVMKDFVSSTAVSRINGYLGGNGSCDMLKEEIDKLGLSEKGNRNLLNQICVGGTGAFCFGSSCR